MIPRSLFCRLVVPSIVAAALAVGAAGAARTFDYYDPEDRKIGGLTVTDVHLTAGQQALRTRWHERAFGEAQWILNQFPNHPHGLLLLVQACEQWKTHRSCAGIDEAFERAIAINPNASGTYTTIGIYRHRKHQYAEAIKSFQQALKLDPNSFNAQYNIGLAYFETKQYDLANQHAQRAYALGAPFPALRSKLQQVGHWKPIPTPGPQPAEASPQPSAGGQGGAVKK